MTDLRKHGNRKGSRELLAETHEQSFQHTVVQEKNEFHSHVNSMIYKIHAK